MTSAAAQPRPSATEATFLVATDRGDDPAGAVILETALQLAREAGARVVLYDRSAESWFTDPFQAAAWHLTHVVLPARITRPSWRERLRGHYVAAFQASLGGVELLLVDADGGVHQIAATAGKPQPARTGALV